MGSKGSKSSSNSSSSSSSSSSASASLPHVLINVYRPVSSTITIPGFGIYHSGVELFDTEYFYGASEGSGVEAQRPRTQAAGSPWTFDQTVDLGTVQLTREEFRTLINSIKSDWPGRDYDLLNHNCNHFSSALCQRLGKSFPAWINRAANVANPFRALVSSDSIQPANQAEYDGMQITDQHKANLALEKVENQELLSAGLIETAQMGILNAVAASFPPAAKSQSTAIPWIFQAEPHKKPNEKWFLQSDSDAQLLLLIPFQKPCKLVGLQLILSNRPELSTYQPKIIQFYVNQRNLDFDDCNDNRVKCNQQEEIPRIVEMKEDPMGSLKEITRNPQSALEAKQHLVSIHVPLKGAMFQSVSYLAIFIESNYGADASRIYGIDFFGRPAEKK